MGKDSDFVTLHSGDKDWVVNTDEFDNKPCDMRGRNIPPQMSNTYKDTAEDYYKKGLQYTQTNPGLLRDIDIQNPKSVVNKANEIIDKMAKDGVIKGSRPCCYKTAAIVHIILDNYKIPHTIYAGAATSKNNDRFSLMKRAAIEGRYGANHVWIESKDKKIYEDFPGKDDNIVHFTINDILNLKKG